MEASPSPQIVGREFVRQYYTVLNKAPADLHRFYNNYSSFVHGDLDAPNCETLPVIGAKQIQNRIQQLNFRDCHVKISQVDAQATLGNGVLVQVTGELSNDGAPMRRFTQTFVLGVEWPKKYFVHNEIFRYQHEETQTLSMNHIEKKIQNAKEMQNTSMLLKEELQTEMNRKILQVENEYAAKLEHLKKKKRRENEIERKQTKLVEERDAQVATIKHEMGEIICELTMRVTETETELATLAAEMRISTLQEQLGMVKSQLKTVETERDTILEDIGNFSAPEHSGKGSSKEMVLNEMGELMESELQCSICNELFVEPTTLNCSHTFCKYCISIWKEKKGDCPVCRASIKSECKSLLLDSFIEKMVQSLSEDMKQKRNALLHDRKDLQGSSNPRPESSVNFSFGSVTTEHGSVLLAEVPSDSSRE